MDIRSRHPQVQHHVDVRVVPPTSVPRVGLVTATVVRHLGRRRVEVALERQERLATVVRLVRHDVVLATWRPSSVPAGRSTLKLRVPKRVAAGHARVEVQVTDAAGHPTTTSSKVWVPGR